MSKEKKLYNSPFLFEILFLTLAFICMLTFAIIQPFGDGPDEINRYKVVQYIVDNGSLPIGDDPAILIDGYGASYAFQPIFTYIIDGFLIRFLSPLITSFSSQLLLARFVNIIFGIIMAIYVRKIARLVFYSSLTGWLFSLAVVFLPQNLFLHSYVNTDSMAFMSIAIMTYAMLKGMIHSFDKKTSITLAIGIILCALSYYNAYGTILISIFIFIISFLSKKDGIWMFDSKTCFKTGSFIAIIVLLGMGWWFIRNALLYNGDFLALNARTACAALTGLDAFNPQVIGTYQSKGFSVFEMIFQTDYYLLVPRSFIAMFGPMLIPTHHYIYWGYYYLLFFAFIGLFLPIPVKKTVLIQYSSLQKKALYFSFILGIIIPSILAIYYSYTWDFQPQGRYYHPILIPLALLLSIGMEKIIEFILLPLKEKENVKNRIRSTFYIFLYSFLILSLIYSVFIILPRYYGLLN
ncbi:MAG: hypothetical protein ACRC7V_05140 [Lachnospiraceae bacterium]